MKYAWSILALVSAVCAGGALLRAQTPADPGATPQGKVVLAYFQAAHAGDVPELRKCLIDVSAQELDGPNGKTILALLKERMPALPPTITKVEVTDNTASGGTEYKEGETTRTGLFQLKLVETEWRIDIGK